VKRPILGGLDHDYGLLPMAASIFAEHDYRPNIQNVKWYSGVKKIRIFNARG